jgi:soluble lytic murein transglycosylase-like protein
MIKIYFLVFSLILCFGGTGGNFYENYTYSAVKKCVASCRVSDKNYKALITVYYADLFSVDRTVLANLIVKESSYDENKYNSNSQACGLMQIDTNYHPMSDPFDIACNISNGARILRSYYRGDWTKALLRYGGFAGKWSHRTNQASNYINSIMGYSINKEVL